MRLLSVHVKNYRIHRDLQVAFDRDLTLLGGPNESGKSTLVEAIHRCLFLPAKGNTQRHRDLGSTLHGGVPEVELVFEQAGRQVTLLKRFSGSNGSAQLTISGEPTLSGEEAENRLDTLLTIQQNRTKEINASWSHLWVWQGQSWQDPADGIKGEHSQLVQRLQRMGGAAVMLSPEATRISQKLQDLKDELFTSKGIRANSDLAKAEAKLAQAEAACEDAQIRLRQLQDAADQMRRGQAELKRLENEVETLKTERAALEQKKEKLRELEGKREQQQAAAQSALDNFNAQKKLHDEIHELSESIATQARDLAPRNTALDQLKATADSARLCADEAAIAAEQAQDAADTASVAYDVAELRLQHCETAAKITELDEKLAEIAAQEQALQEQQGALAKLAAVDEVELSKARQLDRKRAEAEAELKGMATEVVVERADGALKIGDAERGAGECVTISTATELLYGDGLKLLLRPGSVGDLDEAQRAVQALKRELAAVMQRWGVRDLEQAEKILRERERLEAAIAETGRGLKREEPAQLRTRFNAAKAELSRIRAELERRNEVTPEGLSVDALRMALAEARSRREKAQQQAVASRDLARREKDRAKESAEKHRTAASQLKTAQEALDHDRQKLKWMEEQHGDGAQRLKVLEAREQQKTLRERELADTVQQIKLLQPEMVEADEKRLERAFKRHSEVYGDTVQQVNEAQVLLRQDGTADPGGDLERAKANLEQTKAEHNRISIRAQAIALLADRFAQEKQELTERFSAPLADRITGYLQRVFGPEAKASVKLDNDGLTGIHLERDGRGTFEFSSLSIGCQEQVAAAVRLAVAELLADGPGNCLPVVFDDAFTNSDPERTAALQRMLDYAAGRGLQVIVASCNPSDYQALGAKTVSLTPSSASPLSGAPGVTDSALADRDVDKGASTTAALHDLPELEQAFLRALRDKGGSAGNQSLRSELEWSEEVYDQMKGRLLATGSITTGRGRGGSVVLVG
ncbi:MAG: SMC domain-containing protein [Puniceicoccaceae bacterium 5H]|nr:MAG: SMC domain-containing protein [Puniceicoccaceae bacterium 5H]